MVSLEPEESFFFKFSLHLNIDLTKQQSGGKALINDQAVFT